MTAEVIYRDGYIDQHVGLSGSTTTPPRRGRHLALGPAERREAASTFARNQGLEARPHDSGFLVEATQCSGFVEQYIIDDQCGSPGELQCRVALAIQIPREQS